jgi:hypothetical protein
MHLLPKLHIAWSSTAKSTFKNMIAGTLAVENSNIPRDFQDAM